ncbi:hypothetical protein Pan241w_37430 [Gimesia alba]|uniref:Uncharacterized protein n=1 Tax=Gimesia alba TaxID=2527973 RepID=A0A517RIG7_9PLAN|nr:hypothetical protein Pan241w_37430 [Gimesia alba]
MTNKSRRSTVIGALALLCVLLPILSKLLSPKSLSPREQAFVGTYTLTTINNDTVAYSITFLADRSCVYNYNGLTTKGANSQWELCDDHLRISHHYQIVPFNIGLTLPLVRATETDSWILRSTTKPDTFSLTSDVSSLADGTLALTEHRKHMIVR